MVENEKGKESKEKKRKKSHFIYRVIFLQGHGKERLVYAF